MLEGEVGGYDHMANVGAAYHGKVGCPIFFFFFSSRRRHTRCSRDWSSDVCSSDLTPYVKGDLIIVGSNMGLVDRLCRLTPGATPSAMGCASGDGAIVLAINKRTGQEIGRASCRERV